MENAFDYMTSYRCNFAFYQAEKAFTQQFYDKVSLPCKNKTIYKEFTAAKELALLKIDSIAIGDKEISNKLKLKLETKIQVKLDAKIK